MNSNKKMQECKQKIEKKEKKRTGITGKGNEHCFMVQLLASVAHSIIQFK